MNAETHEVIVVGAGPTGMTLAAELALGGVDVLVIERRVDTALVGSRALGLHSRTLEIFDQRGIGERFIARGQKSQHTGFSGIMLDISDLPVRHNYGLALPQQETEVVLAQWIEELGVEVWRGHEVRACAQDDEGVDLTLADGRRLRARYVVGCDGGSSLVRKSAGIEFEGSEPTVSNLIAEARFAEEPPWGIRRNEAGIHGIGKIGDSGFARILLTESELRRASDPSVDELEEALRAVYGTDFGLHDIRWLSRFTDMTRQATRYRAGRLLVAGDAAHVHPPDGGMGIQAGVQDAVNLGWKLAQVVRGVSPAGLLDTYHSERHPVGARMLRYTLASVALRREDNRTKALRETFAELLAGEPARRQMAAALTGLDVRYELGSTEELRTFPLLGRRMPDLELEIAGLRTGVHALLRAARPVLLRFRASGIDAAPWIERIDEYDLSYRGPWDLPAVGAIEGPSAVLIRPDGHVAWIGGQGPARLADALTTWCGPPR